jgi:hypothetical protein
MHLTTNFSYFEIVYEFNPLTPMDLIPLPLENEQFWMVKRKQRW